MNNKQDDRPLLYDPFDPRNAHRIKATSIINDHLAHNTIHTEEDIQLLSKPIKQWIFGRYQLVSISKPDRKIIKSGLEELNKKRRDIVRQFGELRPRSKISPFSLQVFNDQTLYRGKRKEFSKLEEELVNAGWVKGTETGNSSKRKCTLNLFNDDAVFDTEIPPLSPSGPINYDEPLPLWLKYCQTGFPLANSEKHPSSHQEEWAEFTSVYNGREILPASVLGGKFQRKCLQPQTFYPTEEMMKDFTKFYHFTKYCGAHIAGICKVVPYEGYTPRKNGYADADVRTDCPLKQRMYAEKGGLSLLEFTKVNGKEYDLEQMFEYFLKENPTPSDLTDDGMLDMIWQIIRNKQPLYFRDIPGTLFDSVENQPVFNLNELGTSFTMLDHFDPDDEEDGSGLRTPWIYVGSIGCAFAWHDEDKGFGSINYSHHGHPKDWNAIPLPFYIKFLNVLQKNFKENFSSLTKSCANFFLHKCVMTNPDYLPGQGVPVSSLKQEAGTFIISYPLAFHSGHSEGFSIAESVNFGCRDDWLIAALHHISCRREDCIGGSKCTLLIDPWLAKHADAATFDLYTKDTLAIYHPLENAKSNKKIIVGQNIKNKLIPYPIKGKVEFSNTAFENLPLYTPNVDEDRATQIAQLIHQHLSENPVFIN